MFEKSIERFPEHLRWFQQAEETFNLVETYSQSWRVDVSPSIPLNGQAFTFSQTCEMFALTLIRRAQFLAKGVERNIEADDVYSTASVSRSLLELSGAAVMAHRDIKKQLTNSPVDAKAIQRILLRALIGHRFVADLGAPPYAAGDYIRACVEALGTGPKDDYALLSDLAHPGATLIWTQDNLDACSRFEIPTIETTFADVFLRVCVQSPMLALHHLTRLIATAKKDDIVLPPNPLRLSNS